MIEAYLIHLLIIIGIYVILSVSLNVALGYSGLLNLGHVAFFGIGAYASAILTKIGFPFFGALIAAGLLACVFGFVLIYGTKKLKGEYLALATLGFTYVIYSLMMNWTSLTRGALGISGIPKPNILGLTIGAGLPYLIFTIIITLICVLIIYRIIKSPFGRLLEGVRDNETGAKVLGKNTFMLKAKAMMISAFFAGIAGSLFAHYVMFIDPNSFLLVELVIILTLVIVGGIASFKGSIIAPFIIILIPELLRFVSLPVSIVGPMRIIVYALILLGILLIRPRGLFGRIDIE